jgi:hypothetical protein
MATSWRRIFAAAVIVAMLVTAAPSQALQSHDQGAPSICGSSSLTDTAALAMAAGDPIRHPGDVASAARRQALHRRGAAVDLSLRDRTVL